MLYEHRPGPDADLMQATSTAKGAAAALAASGNAGCPVSHASDEEEETSTTSTRRVVSAGLARLRLS